MKDASLKSIVIDTGDDETNRQGLLVNPSSFVDYNLQWVLIPRAGNGNFSEIQKYVACELSNDECSIPCAF